MTKGLHIGYVPLTDATLLHVAKAQHFAAARGVEIELVADSSWANIRDKLVAGHFDAAHMLAPAAIAVSLGIDQIEAPLVAPVALGLNGNAITVSKALFQTLLQEAQGEVCRSSRHRRGARPDCGKAPRNRGSPVGHSAMCFLFPVIITNCGYGCGLAALTPMRM